MKTTRRALLTHAARAAGLAGLSALPLLPRRARAAQRRKPAVVLLWLQGGYNCLFSSADSCVQDGVFGVTAGNVRDVGGGVVVDASTLGTLPPEVLQHMVTVGVHHGRADHIGGVNVWWNRGGDGPSMPLRLTSALGGTSAFRCVSFLVPPGAHRATDGASLSVVPDLSSALLCAGAPVGPELPDRTIMGKGIQRAIRLSEPAFSRSPTMLREAWEGMHTAQAALLGPPQPIDWPEIAAAYGLGSSLTINSFASQLAGAELMIRSGTDVVSIIDRGEGALVGFGWDSHGDHDGNSVRTMMSQRMPALRTFLQRTLAMPDRQIVTAIYGDFARSVHDSGHAGGISASVFSPALRTGTTGRAIIRGPDYLLPPETPGVDAFFAFLCEAAGVASTFGPNPHARTLQIAAL